MKSLIVGFLTLASIAAFAEEGDIVTHKRTLECEGNVAGADQKSIPVKMLIKDYTTEFKMDPEDKEYMMYWSTEASITDPENPSKMLTAVTNNSGDEDPQPMRDEPRDGEWSGLSFFDLQREGSAGGKMNRDGLLALGSQKVELKNKRTYEVGITMGEVTDKEAPGFNGSIICDLKELKKKK